MQSILKKLSNHPALDSLHNHQQRFAHLSIAQEALLIAASYSKHPRAIMVVKPNLFQAQQLYEKIAALLEYPKQVFLYAQEESLRVEAIAQSPEMHTMKMEALVNLIEQSAPVCITHIAAVIRKVPTLDVFRKNILNISVNDVYEPKELASRLQKMGYTQVSRVDQPLTFALRGGIIDVYSINYEHPVRIEFFDNEIESCRFFDLSSQRTIEKTDNITILFATDLLFEDEDVTEIEKVIREKLNNYQQAHSSLETEALSEIIDQDLEAIEMRLKEPYLYRYSVFAKNRTSIVNLNPNLQLIVSSQETAHRQYQHIVEDTMEYVQELYHQTKSLPTYQLHYDFYEALAQKKVLMFKEFDVDQKIDIRWHPTSIFTQPLPMMIDQIAFMSTQKDVLLMLDDAEIRQVIEQCVTKGVPYKMISLQQPIPEGLSIAKGRYDEGFEAVDEGFVVYTSKECFSNPVRLGRFYNRFKEAEVLSSYQQLDIGDYVVHQSHGVGKYLGIVTQEVDGAHRDFLHVAYRGEDTLLVPLEQFRLVRKFVSSQGVVPKLNKLGTSEWAKTKSRISENVDDIADRLISLYAKRQQLIGYQYGPDTPLQQEFESEFDYELTDDQKIAIEEIKKDMMSHRPMDRLLCGDVGFGKTEVAIRAAFKAVSEGKQVAFLCPTTVLSSQHYKTFMKRFKNYPVNIEVLNRFAMPSKVSEVLYKLKHGQVDILIGTHRILSKDVKFKELGLLVIDEEQRFGVEHKEKIKEMRNSIDVLSLSATPIPRTLQMSLIGLRSLSQLNTPPSNRLPVQTYIVEKNKSLIKEIIERELARGGQVFYLYNHVDQIFSLAYQLQQEIPYAKIAVAHGKMNREEIEDVMVQFNANEANVLVCTTIIETGIDIPNANTMIIDRADTFGLSQLYQIKGRVGRSDRLAYAYLMYEPKKQLSEIASKRLSAIKEFTELGSGYKIAMRDLTIRGAGDLLGGNQSGFIDTVGIDMYIEMLQKAIMIKQGVEVEPEEESMAKINLKVDAFIPKAFAPEDLEKINLYQRIDKVRTSRGLNELIDEITDLYGKLPPVVALLFEKKHLEILVDEPRIESFKEHNTYVDIIFSKDYSSSIDGVKWFEIVNRVSKDIELKYINQKISIKVKKHKQWLNDVLSVLIQTKGV